MGDARLGVNPDAAPENKRLRGAEPFAERSALLCLSIFMLLAVPGLLPWLIITRSQALAAAPPPAVLNRNLLLLDAIATRSATMRLRGLFNLSVSGTGSCCP